MNIRKYFKFKQGLQRIINIFLKKQSIELNFWHREIQNYVKWYKGEMDSHYGILSPTQQEKIVQFTLRENVILTWAKLDIEKYPKRLLVPRNYFSGKKLLDVGCRPIPYVLAFTNCQFWGLDPLIDSYRKLGFPLDKYGNRLTYLNASAEKILVKGGFFDAVISANSIDHVDDFPLAARELSRVLRPGGILRMEVHYHPPTDCESWELNDSIIIKHFGPLGIKKVHERPFTELYPEAKKRKGQKMEAFKQFVCRNSQYQDHKIVG